MEFLLVVLVLVAAVLLISAPLRRVGAAEERESAERDRLAAAREAKYREIRELELDYRTGKLSAEDYRAQDVARRAEAVEILRALDALDPRPAEHAEPEPGSQLQTSDASPARAGGGRPGGAERPATASSPRDGAESPPAGTAPDEARAVGARGVAYRSAAR